MKETALLLGETAGLPLSFFQKEEDVFLYKMKVSFPETPRWKEFEKKEKKNLNEFYSLMEKEKVFPTTSQPSLNEFLKHFKKLLKFYKNIICLTITSKHSGTYQAAKNAKNFLKKEEKERILIVDSLQAACAEGLIGEKILELIKKGKGLLEIQKIIKNFVPKVQLLGLLKDIKWLAATGRLSGVKLKIAKFLLKRKYHPLFGIKNGKIKIEGIAKVKDDFAKSLFLELKKRVKKKIRFAINHANNLKEAKRLKILVENNLPSSFAFLAELPLLLGVHAGPGAVGVGFYEK